MLTGVRAAIALALQAPAQAAPAEDQVICVSVAHIWRGDREDIRQISRAPVPESYRRYFSGGGCERWQLVEETLIDWHLAFGTEATTTAALAFLEADYVRGISAPAAFASALPGAWQSAERDFRAAAPSLALTGPPLYAAETRLRQRPSFVRLAALVRAHDNYLFLAEQYLRAAEFYESPALFEKAKFYFAPAEAGFQLLYHGIRSDADIQGVAAQINLSEWHVVEMHDIEMRLAVLRARFSRDPADLDAAARVGDSNYQPLLRAALDNGQEHRGDFCETGDDTSLSEIKEACDGENFFRWRVIDFWRNQAQIDLLMAADPEHYVEAHGAPGSASGFIRSDADSAGAAAGQSPRPENYDPAVLLLESERASHAASGPRHFVPYVDEVLAEMHLAAADFYQRRAERNRRDEANLTYAEQDEQAALTALVSAERLAPPAEAPGRFRRIANLYLPLESVHRRTVATQQRDNADGYQGGDPSSEREAAYFQVVLDRLDRIAVGEGAPQ